MAFDPERAALTRTSHLHIVTPLSRGKGRATVLEQYAEHLRRRRLSEATIRLRTFYVGRFASDNDLVEATEETIERFLDTQVHLSQNTQQTILASLKSFYKWACHKGFTSCDPTFDIPNVRVTYRQGRMASEKAIAQALDNGTRAQQAMLLLGAECGLRVSEIASLNRRNRADDWLVVVGKGNKERTVQMSPELLEILRSIERKGMRRGFYFPGSAESGHVHQSTVWRQIKSVLNSNPHSLRHRAGTVVYQQGGKDLRMVQEFLGHSSPATSAIYVHVGRDDLTTASKATRIAA